MPARSRSPRYLMRVSFGRSPRGGGVSSGGLVAAWSPLDDSGTRFECVPGTAVDRDQRHRHPRTRSRFGLLDSGRSRLTRHLESHALAVFARVYREHPVDRHHDLARDAAEARLELDRFVAELETTGRQRRDVQHDLAIFHEVARHAHRLVGQHGDVRGVPRIRAPLVDRADQVRLGRRFPTLESGRN